MTNQFIAVNSRKRELAASANLLRQRRNLDFRDKSKDSGENHNIQLHASQQHK